MEIERGVVAGGMISRSRAPWESGSWRSLLAEAVRDEVELRALLDLPLTELEGSRAAAADFPLLVPRGFVARMRRADPDDPLLAQVLPVSAELAPVEGFGPDPLAESSVAPAPGMLHKYRGRALVLAAGACAVNCRYCFRRHFPYTEHAAGPDWEPVLAYLAADPSIEEVILSGGDPLLVPDERLSELAQALRGLDHVRRLRLHSRVPIVLPERVDDAFLEWFARPSPSPVLVVHANHPNEIDGAVGTAMRLLREAGVTVLNQAVLLAGVNDDEDALVALSEVLFEHGVLPYYLHLLDPVAGAAHFEVPEARAAELMRGVAARLPGYLVPKLVREVPGAPGKTPIAWFSREIGGGGGALGRGGPSGEGGNGKGESR